MRAYSHIIKGVMALATTNAFHSLRFKTNYKPMIDAGRREVEGQPAVARGRRTPADELLVDLTDPVEVRPADELPDRLCHVMMSSSFAPCTWQSPW